MMMRKLSFLIVAISAVLLLSACATPSEKYKLGDSIPAGYGVLVARSWANYPVDVELQNPANPMRWKYFNLKPGAGDVEYRLVPVGDYEFESIVIDTKRIFIETNQVIHVQENSIIYLGDWLANVSQTKESAYNWLRGADVFGVALPAGAAYFAIVPRCDDYKLQSGLTKMNIDVVCSAPEFPVNLDKEYVRKFIESQNSFWRE